MTTPSPDDITRLLAAWTEGDREALDRLMPLVYEELRRLAHRSMRREPEGHVLQTTALVNEVYLKLVKERGMRWQDRVHFFAVTAHMMRRILVDYARRRNAGKRGGGVFHVSLGEAIVAPDQCDAELIALDEALSRLAAIDERKSRVAELRFFAGLSAEETAEALGVSAGTVGREWRLAKAWLRRELSRDDGRGA
jgi:RNA polymerase sigma factor (TIGR02999 family)